jgi:hypothetical protein
MGASPKVNYYGIPTFFYFQSPVFHFSIQYSIFIIHYSLFAFCPAAEGFIRAGGMPGF